ncbi:MAG: recombinase family protein [Patescibacteria group bacterium]|nr:recombinase family protein [Patescibacteria group bacterium]
MNNEVTLKYAEYARKSSEDNKERQAASLPDQLFILGELKSKQRLSVVNILQESKSAHTPRQREQFQEMLLLIEQGKANAILTWHANRLARNMSDGGDIIDLMDTGKLIEIKTPSRIYHNTPEDKWMLSVEFANSKKDSDDKSVVVKRGLEKKNRDGWRPGVAPFGFLNDKGTESGFRRILTDPVRFPFVQKIFQMFLDGTPTIEILRISHEEWHITTTPHKRLGNKPFTLSQIYKVLNNPFYCGKYEYPVGSGQWHEGSHEKAVTEEIFNQVQIKLGNVSQTTTRHNYAYGHTMTCGTCRSGIIVDGKWQIICPQCKNKFQLTSRNEDRCSRCGLLIEQMPKERIFHYIYHRCHRKNKSIPCTELSVSEKELERQIDDRLSKVELNSQFLNWAIEQVHKMHENEKSFRETTVETTKKAYDDCRKRLDNLVALKISVGNSDGSLLSDEEFKTRKLDLEAELKNIEKQIGNIDERMVQANNNTVKAVSFMARARERFATTNPKTKRDIFLGLGSHLTLQNKMVDFHAPLYFEEVEKMKTDTPIIGKLVASNEQGLDITKMDEFVSSIPSLLRGWKLHPACEIMSLTCAVHYPAVNKPFYHKRRFMQ